MRFEKEFLQIISLFNRLKSEPVIFASNSVDHTSSQISSLTLFRFTGDRFPTTGIPKQSSEARTEEEGRETFTDPC